MTNSLEAAFARHGLSAHREFIAQMVRPEVALEPLDAADERLRSP